VTTTTNNVMAHRGSRTMGSLIEMLANKKKGPAPPTETAVALPVLHKEHEGSCGPNCACASGDEGGCCG
jgi:hypothetical protein